MEGTVRVLAGEFTRSTLCVPDQDREAPGWIVTPGGAWCRRMYLAGALTEVSREGDLCRCRVADPTGVFDLVLVGRNGGLVKALEDIPIPSFVVVTGTARFYRKNGTVSLSVRPEDVRVSDRAERDRLLLIAVEYTLRRLETLALELERNAHDECLNVAIDHYATTAPALCELAAMAETAVGSIRPAPSAPADNLQQVCIQARDLIALAAGPRGIAVEEVVVTLGQQGIPKEVVLAALESLVLDDECYQPQKGYLRLL